MDTETLISCALLGALYIACAVAVFWSWLDGFPDGPARVQKPWQKILLLAASSLWPVTLCVLIAGMILGLCLVALVFVFYEGPRRLPAALRWLATDDSEPTKAAREEDAA